MKTKEVQPDELSDELWLDIRVSEEIENRFLDLKKDLWERARRNPSYITSSKEIKFTRSGYADLKATDSTLLKLAIQCARRFGLKIFVDPKKDFDQLVDPSPDDFPPEWPQYSRLEFYSQLFDLYGYCFPIPHKFLKVVDRQKVQVEIDIERSNEEIKNWLFPFIEMLRENHGVKAGKGGETLRKRLQYYQVWDMRRELSLKEIGSKLGRNYDQVRQQFKRAFELIMGYPYDQQKFAEMQLEEYRVKLEDIKAKAVFPCENCSITECRESMEVKLNWDPCPKLIEYQETIEPYVNQDHVKQREILEGSLHKPPLQESEDS
jgi:hypothetical protein